MSRDLDYVGVSAAGSSRTNENVGTDTISTIGSVPELIPIYEIYYFASKCGYPFTSHVQNLKVPVQ
jgi:hypothetical protein